MNSMSEYVESDDFERIGFLRSTGGIVVKDLGRVHTNEPAVVADVDHGDDSAVALDRSVVLEDRQDHSRHRVRQRLIVRPTRWAFGVRPLVDGSFELAVAGHGDIVPRIAYTVKG